MPIIGYKRPGAYVERVKNVSISSESVSTSVAGIVGVTIRGEANVPVKVTSWKQFTDTFALGYANPFKMGEVAQAVYAFFDNGGTEAVIVRVLNASAVKASGSIADSAFTVDAIEPGVFGNDISVDITSESDKLIAKVSVLGTVVETLKAPTAEFIDYVNANSQYINVKGTAQAGNVILSSGSDGTITVADYKAGLNALDTVEDLNMVAIPGVEVEGVQKAVGEYASVRGNVFPVFDAPAGADLDAVATFKSSLPGYMGAVYYPRVKIKHPITNELVVAPASGYVMGMYARTDANRGIHKAPAGVEAYLSGVVGVERELTEVEIGNLNDNEINCIIPKKNKGIVVWGARLLNVDGDRQFVSDLRVDMYIEELVKRNTEWAVFEPKDESLFNRVEAELTAIFNTLWKDGMLLGETAEEAFYVKCDADLNPDTLSSVLEIEVGYAKKKPAEFVVTKISHKQTSAE